MKKNSILLCLSFMLASLLNQVSAQGIIINENFDSPTFPPNGWILKPVITPTNVWSRKTTPWTNPTATPHSGAALARFASRNFAAGTVQSLVTRAVDYTSRGTNAATLDFWMFRDSLQFGNLDSLTVWVNTADSIDANAVHLGTIARNRNVLLPDTQSVNGWYNYNFSVPASFTGAANYFIFHGYSQSAVAGSGAHIYIDDVSFNEYPPVCTGVPNVGNIVNSSPVNCGGSGSANLDLSAPLTGLPGITYSWEYATSSAGPWTAIGSATTLSTGLLTSTTYYRCIVSCSFSGLNYITPNDSVVINAGLAPTVVLNISSATYCEGSAGVELIASGANTYSWSPSSGLNVAVGDTVYASPTGNTQYIVTGTDSIGCIGKDTVNITFSTVPNVNITANPNDTVCTGTTVILTSLNPGVAGNTYLWSDGKTTRRDTIVATLTANYSVIVTNSAGCVVYDTITLVVKSDSSANFGYTNVGNTYTFIDSSIGGVNWVWSFGDGNGSSSQNPVYTYSAPGTYTVTLIVNGGPCGSDTITKVLTVGPQSLANLNDASGIRFFPNPVQHQLTIESKTDLIQSITIRNQLGQFVKRIQMNSANCVLPTSDLSSGMYFVEIETNQAIRRSTFVKE